MVWLIVSGIVVSIVFFLLVGIYRLTRHISTFSAPTEKALQSVLPKELFSVSPTPAPATPQKTSEYMRGTYLELEKDILEVQGTAGSTEKVRIGDRTEFTCAPRYIRDAQGAVVDMTNILLDVKPGSNYTIRSSTPSFVGRSMFEGRVKPGDIVLVTLGSIDEAAIRVSLIADPCDPGKWKL